MKFNSPLFAIIILLIASGTIMQSCSINTKSQKATPNQTQYHCPMHPHYISNKQGDCPICGMRLVPIQSQEPTVGSTSSAQKNAVYINSVTIQNIGVTSEKAQVRSLTQEIRSGALIGINESRLSIVTTKIMGWIEKLHVNTQGQKVTKGESLFEIYSPEVLSTQEEYLSSLRYLKKQSGSDSSAENERVKSIRQRLLNWDISENQISQLEIRGTAEKTLSIHAPLSGIVLEKTIIEGQNVMPGTPLYKIADLSNVWVTANVYQSDISSITLGMSALIELPSLQGKLFKGKVDFISPLLDESTKTAQVRIEAQNTKEYALKPGMFAQVIFQSAPRTNTLTVPDNAIIQTGKRSVVIVDIGGGYFIPRNITIGISAQGYTQVLSGLAEGEVIVTSSQFLIDSESNLKVALGQMSSPQSVNSDSSDTAAVVKSTSVNLSAKSTLSTTVHKKSDSLKTGGNAAEEWICTMCPEVKSDKPGRCEVCGMRLTLKK